MSVIWLSSGIIFTIWILQKRLLKIHFVTTKSKWWYWFIKSMIFDRKLENSRKKTQQFQKNFTSTSSILEVLIVNYKYFHIQGHPGFILPQSRIGTYVYNVVRQALVDFPQFGHEHVAEVVKNCLNTKIWNIIFPKRKLWFQK